MNTKHTPTPWRTNGTSIGPESGRVCVIDGGHYCPDAREANAKFIVTACNNYDSLVQEGIRSADMLMSAAAHLLYKGAGDSELYKRLKQQEERQRGALKAAGVEL